MYRYMLCSTAGGLHEGLELHVADVLGEGLDKHLSLSLSIYIYIYIYIICLCVYVFVDLCMYLFV